MCACLNVCFSPLRENLFRNKERFKGKNFYVRVGEKVFKAENFASLYIFQLKNIKLFSNKGNKEGNERNFRRHEKKS